MHLDNYMYNSGFNENMRAYMKSNIILFNCCIKHSYGMIHAKWCKKVKKSPHCDHEVK